MKHPILITTSDIRRCHPQGLNCDTDVDYANLANKLVRFMQSIPDLDVWDATYLKTIAPTSSQTLKMLNYTGL